MTVYFFNLGGGRGTYPLYEEHDPELDHEHDLHHELAEVRRQRKGIQ